MRTKISAVLLALMLCMGMSTTVFAYMEDDANAEETVETVTETEVAPLEIFASKTVALLTRTAPRDLYDMHNMIKFGLFNENEEEIRQKDTEYCRLFCINRKKDVQYPYLRASSFWRLQVFGAALLPRGSLLSFCQRKHARLFRKQYGF